MKIVQSVTELQSLPLSAEFREDQQTPRPAAKTDGSQTAAGQRSDGRSRGETQAGERIREWRLFTFNP